MAQRQWTSLHESTTLVANLASRVHADPQDAQDEMLGQTFRNHFVRLTSEGNLVGVISEIDSGAARGVGGLDVYLLQNSEIIAESKTDANGQFTVEQVKPGNYTFCTAGENGFLAYGVHVLEGAAAGAEGEAVPPGGASDAAPSSLHVTLPSHRDVGVMPQRMTLAHWMAGLVEQDPNLQVTAAVVPPEFRSLQGIMRDYVPRSLTESLAGTDDNRRINVAESIEASGFQIMLTPEGNLRGRIAPLVSAKDQPLRLREMNVFLIQNDEIYGRVSVDDRGQFEFQDVAPGIYGFAAAGKDGFAAMSFETATPIAPETPDAPQGSVTHGTVHLASHSTARQAAELEVALCLPEDMEFLRRKLDELVEEEEAEDEPVDRAVEGGGPGMLAGPGGYQGGYPMFGGGGFGGGGFDGGAGAFGGQLIEFALAAWLISELGDDDSSTQIPPPPPPASPINP